MKDQHLPIFVIVWTFGFLATPFLTIVSVVYLIDYSIKNKNSFSIVRCCIFIGAEVINIIFLKYPRLISIGIASFPDDAKNIIELLHNADLALFKAKEKGGNRIINFDIGIHKNSH